MKTEYKEIKEELIAEEETTFYIYVDIYMKLRRIIVEISNPGKESIFKIFKEININGPCKILNGKRDGHKENINVWIETKSTIHGILHENQQLHFPKINTV